MAEVRPAPPPPPAAVQMGTLQVGTRVWVDVYVDGRKVGRAPNRTRYELPAGPHRLRAEQPGSDCAPFEDAFTIRPGETTRMRLSDSCP